jgi:hypothetical protein
MHFFSSYQHLLLLVLIQLLLSIRSCTSKTKTTLFEVLVKALPVWSKELIAAANFDVIILLIHSDLVV